MLNTVNERLLTVSERKSILMRSLNATPYFNHTSIDLTTGVPSNIQLFRSRRHVYLDFFVTEVRQNIGQMQDVNGFGYNLSIYLANLGIPIYGYNKSQPLPASFIATDTPKLEPAFVTAFDSRQRESVAFKIEAGDEIITQVSFDNAVPIATAGTFRSTIAGFQSLSYPYLNGDETEKINRSLDQDTVFQTFKIDVEADNITRAFNVTNDNTPRLILGFGVVDDADRGEAAHTALIDVFDTIRHVKITSEPMPLEALATRIPSVQDSHIYYLPIEHYFCPFGSIRLTIKNSATAIAPELDHPYQIVMLTRTV